MKLDSEAQRKTLLGFIKAINFPGEIVDEIYKIKQDIIKAKIEEPPKKKRK